MSKRQFLMILGALTIVLLFLGFPSTTDRVIFIVIGALVIVTASRIKPEMRQSKPIADMPYVEHKQP